MANSPRGFSGSKAAMWRWPSRRSGRWPPTILRRRGMSESRLEKEVKRSWRLRELDTKLGKVLTVMKELRDGSAVSSFS